MNKFNQPFHLVTPSPWPLLTSISIMNNFLMTVTWFNSLKFLLFLTLPCSILCLFQWWRDVIRESTFQGFHTFYTYQGLRLGMILFIISEIFFFMSFFWTFFHSSLSPTIEIGQLWPPQSIHPFNPYNIPLLNTIILISSGLTITWSHYSLISMNFMEMKYSLILTISLGIYFTSMQIFEYYDSLFTMSDSIYGSIFFLTTGFHGSHVLIGTLFIMICFYRFYTQQFSQTHHFGLEAAIWYWHFVDVIWLFLFMLIYYWSF